MMTIDEAIEHCIEKGNDYTECGKEHLQLAEWLKELKFFRAWYRKWYYNSKNKTYIADMSMINLDNYDIHTTASYCKKAVNDN